MKAPRFLPGLLLGVVVIFVPIGLVWWFWCGPSTTLVLVRHADRDGQLDALTAAGTARAQELAHVGMKAEFAAIYRSDTNRTRDTAAPLAMATGLTPVVYPANDVDQLMAQHPGRSPRPEGARRRSQQHRARHYRGSRRSLPARDRITGSSTTSSFSRCAAAVGGA